MPPSMAKFEILLTEQAKKDLTAISDTRSATTIKERIDRLEHDALALGKALQEPLSGYHHVRAAKQRYRVVYRVAVIEAFESPAPPKPPASPNLPDPNGLVIGIGTEGNKRHAYRVASKQLGSD